MEVIVTGGTLSSAEQKYYENHVLEKYSKNFLDNIDMAQKFTFQDGINGLKRMAEQATAIKWDMQQTASFADKVSTVEGSIKTGARFFM